jgi:hypothetical protein
MPTVALACALLVVLTGLLHYEVLRGLHSRLPESRVPGRLKLLVVVAIAFIAHALEILLYGLAIYVLPHYFDIGHLVGASGSTFSTSLYFSAETYTSLGFGDIAPHGALRLVAGVEALNGLLLIGWTASFTYISMERFWGVGRPGHALERK